MLKLKILTRKSFNTLKVKALECGRSKLTINWLIQQEHLETTPPLILSFQKIMIRPEVYQNVTKDLVNGAIGSVTEISWPNYARYQLYDECLPYSVTIDFGKDGIHQINPIYITEYILIYKYYIIIQFLALRSYSTAEHATFNFILGRHSS